MSGHQTATIEDTVYFWFAANDTSGSGDDGASPVFDVREAGAAADAIPLLSGSATLLSHANYPAGCHEIAVAATDGNGFAADDTFAVFCTLLVDSQNPTGFVGSCTLTPLAKATALATAQSDLDTLTGADGATLATAQGNYAPAKAGDSMALSAGAITDASLAGAMEIVFETDFGTNYNTTRNAWVTNHTDYLGTIPAAALGADCITSAKIADGAFVAANFAASSLDGKGNWNIGKTGYALTTADWNVGKTGYALVADSSAVTIGTVQGAVGSVTGAVGSVTGHTNQTGDSFAIVNGAAGLVAIDTVVDSIKAVTDKFVFTVANQVDANITYVNDVAVTGTGAGGDEWGP